MNTEQKPTPTFRLFPGLWIVLGISVLLAARVAWVRPHDQGNIVQLAKEFSSIDALREAPVFNHAGTLFGLVHNTDNGMGVFVANITNQTEQSVWQTNDADNIGDPGVMGWSPDDSVVAYRLNEYFYFQKTGETNYSGGIPAPNFQSFTWLSSDKCAYIDSSPDDLSSTRLAVAQDVNGAWQETASWPLTGSSSRSRSMLSTGPDTVVWQTGDRIWQMDVTKGQPACLYTTTNSISSLTYSPDANAFLLAEAARRAHNYSLFSWSNGSTKSLMTGKSPITDAQWIDHGKGYACLISGDENNSLFVQTSPKDKEKTFFADSQIVDFSCNSEGSRIFVFGSYTNEAPAVWQCNADTGDTRRIFSPWGFAGNDDVHFQPALLGYAAMPDKHREKFMLIPPADFSRHKKYPLIIGLQGYDWMNVPQATYCQALANSAAYVALTGYHYKKEDSLESLLANTNKVLAIYNQMIQNPNVDPNRVYLFAFSSSSIVMNKLIEAYPGRWRGVMLFNPASDLPMPDTGPVPALLVTAGSDEDWLSQELASYQITMAKAGVPMDWYVHSGEGHIERAKDVMYQRSLLMHKMIFGDLSKQ
ncbi:MAG TPA: hypothetical protein VGN23_01295 [Verrucomicrobiae bacterium]|jgi:dipeptidyl aminopeptidase/acylaminoacyl peptidase